MLLFLVRLFLCDGVQELFDPGPEGGILKQAAQRALHEGGFGCKELIDQIIEICGCLNVLFALACFQPVEIDVELAADCTDNNIIRGTITGLIIGNCISGNADAITKSFLSKMRIASYFTYSIFHFLTSEINI